MFHQPQGDNPISGVGNGRQELVKKDLSRFLDILRELRVVEYGHSPFYQPVTSRPDAGSYIYPMA